MALSRVVGIMLCAVAMALPAVASAENPPPKNVDWSTINDSEPVVRVDAYGGTSQAFGGTAVPTFGIRGAATFSHILHAGATATFFVPPGATGMFWSPALEIGLDPPTGNFEIRPLLGVGVLLGSFEAALPTIYPGVTIGYRDQRRKFFIGGEARANLLADFHFVFLPATISTMGVLGGYL